ncbi:MAG TPA: hypothetical protein VND89_09630 [Acidimicrobiales bacterium]|nr:hypothetical protein [Acidimicrobiales bacterium]
MEVTIAEAAEKLQTTVPRVTRALARALIEPTIRLDNKRRVRVLSSEQVRALESELGIAPDVDGYSREDMFVLAAFNLSPYGFRSVYAVSLAAVISATTAEKVVTRLIERGLIAQVPQKQLLSRKVVDVDTFQIDRRSDEWRRLFGHIASTQLPAPRRVVAAKIIPRRFWHLFWNANPLQLPLDEHANYIATRMLLSEEPQAVAWAVTNLPASSISYAATMRNASEDDRKWLNNLALAMSEAD